MPLSVFVFYKLLSLEAFQSSGVTVTEELGGQHLVPGVSSGFWWVFVCFLFFFSSAVSIHSISEVKERILSYLYFSESVMWLETLVLLQNLIGCAGTSADVCREKLDLRFDFTKFKLLHFVSPFPLLKSQSD